MQKDKGRDKPADNITEKVLHINRCSKVVKGGRKFSFSALILASDEEGRVGFGFAKANELTDAIKKGGEIARNGMQKYELEGTTIPHEIISDWDGAKVLLRPAPRGSGVIAGSMIRAILEMAGIKDIMAKNLGCNNPLNQVRATFKALGNLLSREEIRALRK